MLMLNSLISTVFTSLAKVNGLIIDYLTLPSILWRNNDTNMNSSSKPSESLTEGDIVDFVTPVPTEMSCVQPIDDQDENKDVERTTTVIKKGRVVSLIRDGLACWHFLATILHLIKRALAVKVHFVERDKVVLNNRRVVNLSTRLRDTVFK